MSQSGFFPKSEDPDHEDRELERAEFDPAEAPGRNRIEKFRAIVRARSVMTIEGQPVDIFSASTVVAVYDALSKPESRHTLMGFLDVRKVVDTALKVTARSQRRRAS